MKKLMLKLGGLLAAAALVMGTASTYYLCFVWFHQPKEPECLRARKLNRIS